MRFVLVAEQEETSETPPPVREPPPPMPVVPSTPEVSAAPTPSPTPDAAPEPSPPPADAPPPSLAETEADAPKLLAAGPPAASLPFIARTTRDLRARFARVAPGRQSLLLALLVFGPVTITSAVVLIASRPKTPPSSPEASMTTASTSTSTPSSDAPQALPDPTPAVVVKPSEAPSAVVPSSSAPPPIPVWRVATMASDPAYTLTEAPVGRRPFVVALGAAGVAKGDVQRLLAALDDLRRFDRCNPKDTFTVVREKRTGKLAAFEYATSPFEVFQARVDGNGAVDAKRLDLRVERVAVAVAITVGDDLRASIVKAGLDDDLLKTLDDALHGHMELASVRPGARLRILASEDRVEGAFGRYAELEAVEYLPPSAKAPPLRVYHFGAAAPVGASGMTSKTKLGGYYDAKGRQPYSGGWRSPVPLARISSRFNPRRMHPTLHVVMPHNGMDFAAQVGTPIYATAPGTIKMAGDGGPCGNMVQILHSNGLVSAYCHMSRFGPVHAGQHVEGRQLIGYVGQTGRATGPHLHFAVKRGDIFLDPMSMKLDGVRVLPLAARDEFEKHREELDARLDAIALPAASYGDAGVEEGPEPEIIFDQPP